MRDICSIPLRDDQLVKLVKLRVGIYFCPKTGEARISQGYWQRADDVMRVGITVMIAPNLLSQTIEEVEAKRQEVDIDSGCDGLKHASCCECLACRGGQ